MRFRVDDSASAEGAAEVWRVYDAVFGDFPDCGTWRGAVWDRHRHRAGFRIARAYDSGVLVGFAYGYTGEHGQWWTDNARKVLDPGVAEAWLGGHFELVSIGVIDAARLQGVGRRLMRVLLDGLPHVRRLLMTSANSSDPARRLYASEGWRVIGSGIGHGTVIMAQHALTQPPAGGPPRGPQTSTVRRDPR
jgi:GNAT superfamily N-acetyltransferase